MLVKMSLLCCFFVFFFIFSYLFHVMVMAHSTVVYNHLYKLYIQIELVRKSVIQLKSFQLVVGVALREMLF